MLMQVRKTVFRWVSTPPSRSLARMNAVRITAWLAMSAIFWIAGGIATGELRLVLWAIALCIEYISPAVRFWIPRYGASSVADWVVEGGHMAERCAGFIIIALGESIVVTGATFADLTWTTENVTAFTSAFVGSLAMWWIYFHRGAEAGSEQISKSSEPGRLARLAYTYLHMPIVAGIIVTAVADELVLKHPTGHSDLKTVLSAIGGPLVPGRNEPVQAQLSRLPSALARCRNRRPRCACLVCRRTIAADAIRSNHRDHDCGRSVEIDLAAIGRGGIAGHNRQEQTTALFLSDSILEDEVGQLDHKRPKPAFSSRSDTIAEPGSVPDYRPLGRMMNRNMASDFRRSDTRFYD
jgi:hypothetical protein